MAINKKDKVPNYLLDRVPLHFPENDMSQTQLLFFCFFNFCQFIQDTHAQQRWHEEARECSQAGPKQSCLLSTVCLWYSLTSLLGCLSSSSLWYHSFHDTTSPRPHLIFVPLMGRAGFAFKSTTPRILFVFCSYEHFCEF